MKMAMALLAGCLAAALTGAAYADGGATTAPATPASDAILDRLHHQLSSVDTVEADFVQEKNLAILKHTLTIRGHFALQKPDRVIWIVKEPVSYAIRIDGDEVRQWDQETNKVQVVHIGGDPAFQAVSAQIQAWFMGDYKALAKSYDLTLESEKPLCLGFDPKADTMIAKVIKHVDLTFGKDELYIDKMVVHEADGSITTLRFVGAKINEPVEKETWEIPPHER